MYKKYIILLSLLYIINYSVSYSIDSNNTKCNLCKDVINIIDAQIHLANSTISIIEQIVKGFCNDLTILPIQKKECLFLLEHIQDIINWIMEGLSPGDICNKFGFCKQKIIL